MPVPMLKEVDEKFDVPDSVMSLYVPVAKPPKLVRFRVTLPEVGKVSAPRLAIRSEVPGAPKLKSSMEPPLSVNEPTLRVPVVAPICGASVPRRQSLARR